MARASFWQHCSQSNLVLTQECNFKCSFCKLWQADPLSFPSLSLVDLIRSGRFFKHYPKTKMMNVVGGEAMCFRDITYVLTFLKAEGIWIRLWTNGVYNVNLAYELKKVVDEWVLYIPSSESTQYQDMVGTSSFSIFESCLEEWLVDQRLVTLNFPVKPDTIQCLPEVYEFAYYKRLPLIIHYSKSDLFSAESILYIQRFLSISNVTVFCVDLDPYACYAFPGLALVQPFQMIRNRVSEWISLYR